MRVFILPGRVVSNKSILNLARKSKVSWKMSTKFRMMYHAIIIYFFINFKTMYEGRGRLNLCGNLPRIHLQDNYWLCNNTTWRERSTLNLESNEDWIKFVADIDGGGQGQGSMYIHVYVCTIPKCLPI